MQIKDLKLEEIILGSNVRSPVDRNSPQQQELMASIKTHNILHPLLFLPPIEGKYPLLDGFRRFDAALALGLKSVPGIVTERMLSDTEIRLIQLTTSIHRADLSGYEKWMAAAELMCMNPGWQMQDLAGKLNLSPASITRLLSPSRNTPAWQEALREGKVTISDNYVASKRPLNEQDGLLALKLSGANREELETASRKPRTASLVKLSSIKLPLPSGTTVTVKGDDLGGEELVEALTQARDAAIKANKENIDVKTLARVMADKAKAGV